MIRNYLAEYGMAKTRHNGQGKDADGRESFVSKTCKTCSAYFCHEFQLLKHAISSSVLGLCFEFKGVGPNDQLCCTQWIGFPASGPQLVPAVPDARSSNSKQDVTGTSVVGNCSELHCPAPPTRPVTSPGLEGHCRTGRVGRCICPLR